MDDDWAYVEMSGSGFSWEHGQDVFYLTNCIDRALATVTLDPDDRWHVEIHPGRESYRWPHTFETDTDALNHAEELLRLLHCALPEIPDLPPQEPDWSWDN